MTGLHILIILKFTIINENHLLLVRPDCLSNWISKYRGSKLLKYSTSSVVGLLNFFLILKKLASNLTRLIMTSDKCNVVYDVGCGNKKIEFHHAFFKLMTQAAWVIYLEAWTKLLIT